eukprot:6186858-Pleurochrysis_carterae.AAC.2
MAGDSGKRQSEHHPSGCIQTCMCFAWCLVGIKAVTGLVPIAISLNSAKARSRTVHGAAAGQPTRPQR